jgi:hypothetical protein
MVDTVGCVPIFHQLCDLINLSQESGAVVEAADLALQIFTFKLIYDIYDKNSNWLPIKNGSPKTIWLPSVTPKSGHQPVFKLFPITFGFLSVSRNV